MWHVYFQNFKAHPAEDAAGMAFPAFSENPNLASTSSSLIFLKAPPPDGGLGEEAFFPGPDNSDLAGHVGNMPFKKIIIIKHNYSSVALLYDSR